MKSTFTFHDKTHYIIKLSTKRVQKSELVIARFFILQFQISQISPLIVPFGNTQLIYKLVRMIVC